MIFEKIRERLQEQAERYQESLEGQHCIDYRWIEEEGLQATEEAIEIVNQVEAEYNNGWIPCSERLPECESGCETQALLFQIKETDTMECGYYGVGGEYRDNYFRPYTNSTDGFDARDVIAWQPLPEPYKPKVDKPTEPEWKSSVMNHFTKGE